MSSKTDTAIAADYEYNTTKIRGADGKVRHSRGNQDAIAKAMLVFIAAGGTTKEVVQANGLDAKQGERNEGLFRMAVGNMLRAKVRAGETVKIGKIKVEKLNQHVDLPKLETKAPQPRKATAKVKRNGGRKPAAARVAA